MFDIKVPKKLIEVALPLNDINSACMHEKQPGIGSHPRGLHLWWARRPLPAARAVLFAQMVNDPGYERDLKRGVNKKDADIKREILFQIIRDLVRWENTNNQEVLTRARDAIKDSWIETCNLNRKHPQAAELFNPNKIPAFHDPFAGGGAIPLEAQRLGLESHASDLNPVAVMINKAMIEIPPNFAGQAPIGPEITKKIINKKSKTNDIFENWGGAKGLAEDVRRYGLWMNDKALQRIGHLYPKIVITKDIAQGREDLLPYMGKELTIIAWLWSRTVKSPNPAYSNVYVPLAHSFILSNKIGKEAWVEPVITNNSFQFIVRIGKIPNTAFAGTVKRTGATCIMSNTAIPFKYIREEGKAGRIKPQLMAIVVEGRNGRIYLSPTEEMVKIANSAKPAWEPEHALPTNPRDFKTPNYGMRTFGSLFTPRQLVALNTFSDLVKEARIQAIIDAKDAGMANDGISLNSGGKGATAYGDALAVYLSFAVDRLADYNCTISTWKASGEQVMQTYKRQALPMTWDFPESNVLIDKSICWLKAIKYCADNLEITCRLSPLIPGRATQQDAATQKTSVNKVVSTDPPYYDNIGYADLSDFFYVWMRRSLQTIYTDLFATLVTPKAEELIATAYRHGNKEKAERFFLDGMTRAIQNLAEQAHPAFPVTIYYAFKQTETKADCTSNTGWETFLEAVLSAGFSIDGTWPMRTELANRMIASGSNALASSIVLVCRKRVITAATVSRREFQKELRETMPESLETMIGGKTGQTPIAPVDLAQAAIGPGMAIFSKYAAVLNQDGTKMTVHEALIMINKSITEYLNPDSGNFDNDTLFCVSWFDQYGWGTGPFGEADTLARAKGTSVDGVYEAGVTESGSGKVRLMKWAEYPENWDPAKDKRLPIWEACHHMIHSLNQKGENTAGKLLARMPDKGELIRQLAYHLYTLCERRKWADDARAYNELITCWHEIVLASNIIGHSGTQLEFGIDFEEGIVR